MRKDWSDQAWEDYLFWLSEDKQKVKRINKLLKDIDRGGYEGIGKPEALRANLSGWWSRRITEEHRLVYRIKNQTIEILSVRYHYENE